MDLKGLKFSTIEKNHRLTDSELEKATTAIERLPENTFMSTMKSKKRAVVTPNYINTSNLNIQYAPKSGHLFIRGYWGTQIGLITIPEKAKHVVTNPNTTSFNLDDTRYIIAFK